MSEHSVQVNRLEDRTALVNVFVCGHGRAAGPEHPGHSGLLGGLGHPVAAI